MKNFLFLIALMLPVFIYGQLNLPLEMNITADGILKSGDTKVEGLYNTDNIHKLEITLEQDNWFTLMDGEQGGGPGGPGGGGGQDDGEMLMGTLTFNDDIVLDSVMVGIKGQTSDFRNNSEKKSFKIEIDELKKQDLMGYDNLNLNCAFDDHSSMREVLFYDISRGYAPALKGAFVDLYINGQYWGPYNNIQQLEGTYIKEWFSDNEGTRWRALNSEDTGGGGPGGGGMGDPSRFGAGVSTLNFNGADTSDYQLNYEFKKSGQDNPWEDLVHVCDVLNNTPIEDLYTALNPILDIDRTLWILAQEITVSDDDGYFFKGGMDYYVYYDNATGRLMPMEVDGNSVMNPNNVNWSPFYREDDERFPLINKMLQNAEIRQRYLAHLRTVLADFLVEDKVNARIDEFAAMIDQKVQDDPKKLYTYTQFTSGVTELKRYMTDRISFLSSHAEINRVGVSVSAASHFSVSGEATPVAGEEVIVQTTLDASAQKVILYYATGVDGAFARTEMVDDGTQGDDTAGDNIYGATLPGFAAGDFVRYYVEAISDDTFATATYFPTGAEHEVFIYQVQPVRVAGEVVINEFMASNGQTVADGSGGFADWIELYNNGDEPIDLSGYFLSDDLTELDKWTFPDNTVLNEDDYLIVWADSDEEDTTADELHANFKLSASGESVILSNPQQEVLDQEDYTEQRTDISFARIPNGTGGFAFRTETFSANNDTSMSNVYDVNLGLDIKVFPNPTSGVLYLEAAELLPQRITAVFYDALGRVQQIEVLNTNSFINSIDLSSLSAGIYHMQLRDKEAGLISVSKIFVAK